MKVRDVEKIIDEEHKGHEIFKINRLQAMYSVLSTFEYTCSSVMMASVLNPFALKSITDLMDSLNMALAWINELCPVSCDETIQLEMSEECNQQCADLLHNYAYPYSVICSGYIAYSRKRFSANVVDDCVTFDLTDTKNNSAWNDILREATGNDLSSLSALVNPYELLRASGEIKKHATIENGMLCYSLSGDVFDAFEKMARAQWDITKALPESWKFEKFSLAEYKEFWIALTSLCYVHLCSCFGIEDQLLKLRNSVIVQNKQHIVNFVKSRTKLDKEKIAILIDYITYEPQKTNVDIMYQPVVALSDSTIVITPTLFMGSRPERNLLSVVSTRKDKVYFNEVNDLEGVMVSELESFVKSEDVVKHKHLRDDLPDLDFAVLDKETNSALICETKWFAPADSSKEVYAKEDEINHGCQQVENIMTYAMEDKNHFFKQVFGIENGEMIDLFWCVVAKHNIRTQNKNVPVIDLKRIEELFSSYSLNTVFHCIRNHEYEIKMPEDASITYKEIEYAGFKFRIPALCFGSMPE